MKQQNCNYITCYRKKDGYIYIYLKNGEKYRCTIGNSIIHGRYYLSFRDTSNCYLFTKLIIDKYELASRFPGKYFDGDWPESKTEEDVFILLRELIKESKKKYALETEL
jgi:hypothetical protein